MTRPESLLVLPVVLGYQVLAKGGADEKTGVSRRRASLIAVTAAVVIGAVTIWRLAYYGASLPNSVAAKSALSAGLDTLLANLGPGLLYAVRFEIAHAPLILGAAIALILAPKAKALWFCLLVVARSCRPSSSTAATGCLTTAC